VGYLSFVSLGTPLGTLIVSCPFAPLGILPNCIHAVDVRPGSPTLYIQLTRGSHWMGRGTKVEVNQDRASHRSLEFRFAFRSATGHFELP